MRHCLRLLTLLALAACVTDPVPAQTPIPVPYDSVGPVTHDSTISVTHDTTYRVCCRDSFPPAPPPPPPTSGKHPHEPAGFARLWEHDFTTAPAIGKYALSGAAGCWYANAGAKFVGGKYQVTYPVGFAEGKTPAKLEAHPACPRGARSAQSLYVHLTGYQPGDGTPAWVNGAGNKALFIDYGGSKFVFKCDAPAMPSGVKSSCLWTLHTPAGLIRPTSGRGVVLTGQPNDIECVIEPAKTACWVNGTAMTWATGPGQPIYGVWHDWTYGGGGGGTPVGTRSVWTLDGSYGSGR